MRRVTYVKGWRIVWYFCLLSYPEEPILSDLKRLSAPSNILARVKHNIRKNSLDSGFTYSNKLGRESVVVIGRTSNGYEFLNSFSHELRHLCDDICEAYGMHNSGEAIAYLQGEVSLSVADIVCKFSCKNCRYETNN